ncbi:MAG: hypothetical protein H6828_05080 [Planctomycetes bacterium]|nr:hypothetical protein [Planctomycetota bacterium]
MLTPSAAADVAMAIYNADGSRPEACGNGLRCTAWHLARTRGLDAARVATDAGVRAVRVLSRAGDAAVLLAEMGPRASSRCAPRHARRPRSPPQATTSTARTACCTSRTNAPRPSSAWGARCRRTPTSRAA